MLKGKHLPYVVFTIVFLFSFLFQFIHGVTPFADDIWFSNIVHTRELFPWLVERYATWSSRTLIEFFIYIFIDNINVWIIVNSCMLASLVVAISYIVSKKIDILIIGFVCLLLIYFPNVVTSEAVWWMTGSINYLWPVSFSLVAWAILLCRTSFQSSLLSALLIGASSFNEQIAIVNLFTLCLSLFYRDWKRFLPSTIVCLILLVFIIVSPGNSIRIVLETNTWMPSFANYGVIEKVILGLNSCVNFVFGFGAFLIAMLCFAIAFSGRNVWVKSLALFFSLMLISGIFGSNFTPRAIQLVFNYLSPIQLTESNITSWSIIFRIGAMLLFLLSIYVMASLILDSLNQKIALLFAFAISFIPTAMLGFSPTVYASGKRTLFVSSILIVILSAKILSIGLMEKMNRQCEEQLPC